MTNQQIYKSSLRLLAESTGVGDNDDYEERAPYIIANFCSETYDADVAYRKAYNLESPNEISEVYLPLENEFPRSPRFSSAACVYLASMLVLDTNPELSDRLFDRYSDMLAGICSSIPALIENIEDRYN